MKNMELTAAKLSIKNFCALMQSIETVYEEEYEGAIAKIAALSDTNQEEIEELDLQVVKELSKELTKVNLQSVVDTPLRKEFEFNGCVYKVLFLPDGSLNLKFIESKYLRGLLSSELKTNKVFYDNLHSIAAVLFKPETESKFNQEEVEQRAELFREEMTMETIYPYIRLITEKLS